MTTEPRERQILLERLERLRARDAATYIPRPIIRHVPFWQRVPPLPAVLVLLVLAALLALVAQTWGL